LYDTVIVLGRVCCLIVDSVEKNLTEVRMRRLECDVALLLSSSGKSSVRYRAAEALEQIGGKKSVS
jgi:hypothetical protein